MIDKIEASGFTTASIAVASGAAMILLRLIVWLVTRLTSGSGPFQRVIIDFGTVKVSVARKSPSTRKRTKPLRSSGVDRTESSQLSLPTSVPSGSAASPSSTGAMSEQP